MPRPSLTFRLVIGLCLGLLAFASHSSHAATMVRNGDEVERTEYRLVLPYAFHTEAMGLAVGLAAGFSGYGQPQLSFGGTLMGSSKDTLVAFAMFNKLQVPSVRRLFITGRAAASRYNDLRAYVDGNPAFPDERSGSNVSSEDNFLEGSGWSNWADVELQYLLPIGHGRDQVVHTYRLRHGLLETGRSGGEHWNPLQSGRTSLYLTPFYQNRWYEVTETERLTTNGLEFALEHDNRDFEPNPERGSYQKFALKRDFGWFDSIGSWTSIEADLRKYIALPPNRHLRQQVLAFNLWTADTPSWRDHQTDDGRPPYFEGATLGGFYRMRAYPFDRYNDRAALYYGAEYRAIPRAWTLGSDWRFINISWWQLVGFAELGRVAEGWSLEELHSDMQWDLGVGLRTMANLTVLRLDLAVNDDALAIWAMVNHPF